LNGLKTRCEAIAAICGGVRIELTTAPAMKIMSIRDSCSEKEISNKLGELYGEISAEMVKQRMEQSGSVFGIYHSVSVQGDSGMYFVFEAGIPVNKKGTSAGRVNYSEIGAARVVKAYHYGLYNQTPATHEKIEAWMKAYKLPAAGPVWEIYVTDPMTESDPSKWLTEINYPY
jgi:effector-binding domain-containing protein